MNGLKLVAAAAAALALSGCASIVSGTTQEIKISSNPAGAAVFVGHQRMENDVAVSYFNNTAQVGVTPMTVRVPRKNAVIELRHPGYQPTPVPLVITMNPWVWGDILLTSPLSTSIDSSTGAINQYDPGEYMIDMKPEAK